MNPKKLARKLLPKKLIPLSEEVYRKGRLKLTHTRYHFPAKHLRIIAVTGTNGKTSTCCYINDILRQAGYSTALFTTAVIEMAGERRANTSHRTVPLTKDLFTFLASAKKNQVDFVILETTSHSLHQHKNHGIPIEFAVMTNLSQDHLDYHGNMEAYASSKARLFNSYMNPKHCVLNDDDEWFDYYKTESVGQIHTYGRQKSADLCISSLRSSDAGLKLRLDSAATNSSIVAVAPLIGEFNGYNLAAAVSVALQIGVAPDLIRSAISAIRPVPGRMELIRSSKGFGVVVDYAHTSDALEKALGALRSIAKGSVSVVFGATGDRDKAKRPIMGQVASENADYIYLTDDETYSENGATIRRAVMAGIKASGGAHKTTEIADRLEAIKSAIASAKKGDMILVAGLGHQDYRAMNEGNIPWQESEVVKSTLQQMKKL